MLAKLLFARAGLGKHSAMLKELEQKHLSKQIPGLPSSLFLGLMRPDKNRDESDSWAQVRPTVCHLIKRGPQGMERHLARSSATVLLRDKYPCSSAVSFFPPSFSHAIQFIQFRALAIVKLKDVSHARPPPAGALVSPGKEAHHLTGSCGHRQPVVMFAG